MSCGCGSSVIDNSFVEAREYSPQGTGMRISISLGDVTLFSQHKETNKTMVMVKPDQAYLLDMEYDDFRKFFTVYKLADVKDAG